MPTPDERCNYFCPCATPSEDSNACDGWDEAVCANHCFVDRQSSASKDWFNDCGWTNGKCSMGVQHWEIACPKNLASICPIPPLTTTSSVARMTTTTLTSSKTMPTPDERCNYFCPCATPSEDSNACDGWDEAVCANHCFVDRQSSASKDWFNDCGWTNGKCSMGVQHWEIACPKNLASFCSIQPLTTTSPVARTTTTTPTSSNTEPTPDEKCDFFCPCTDPSEDLSACDGWHEDTCASHCFVDRQSSASKDWYNDCGWKNGRCRMGAQHSEVGCPKDMVSFCSTRPLTTTWPVVQTTTVPAPDERCASFCACIPSEDFTACDGWDETDCAKHCFVEFQSSKNVFYDCGWQNGKCSMGVQYWEVGCPKDTGFICK